MAQLGSNWVLEADIQKFFDKVDRSILKKKLRRVIKSDDYIDLIVRALSSEIANPTKQDEDYLSQFPSSDSGIPQGNILSPLLANFYLYSFDRAMLAKGFGLVRYADDFVVMCKSKTEAENAFAFAMKLLKTDLALDLHPLSKGGKTDIKLYRDGFDFLGFEMGTGILRPSKKAIKKLHDRIKEIFLESVQTSPLVRKINRINNGYKGWIEAFKGSSMLSAATSADEVLANELTKLMLKEKFLRRGDRLSYQQIKVLGIYTLRERLSKNKFRPKSNKTPASTAHPDVP